MQNTPNPKILFRNLEFLLPREPRKETDVFGIFFPNRYIKEIAEGKGM